MKLMIRGAYRATTMLKALSSIAATSIVCGRTSAGFLLNMGAQWAAKFVLLVRTVFWPQSGFHPKECKQNACIAYYVFLSGAFVPLTL